MENWMINIAVGAVGVVSILAVMRSNVTRLSGMQAKQEERITRVERDLAVTRNTIKDLPKISDVHELFISQSEFKAFEKRIDDKFITIQKGIDSILTQFEKIK